ncbi:hypothetical protein [Indiicoccus explosivorum]|uniref:hypothetical protein n=1 Tax=Indiicoccus explosivorum TaxID=1917864 RepID=UPI000B43E549|nr:hypothetical protein [Indiicoccus explosivorum]
MKNRLFSLTLKQSFLIVLTLSALPVTVILLNMEAGFSRLAAAGRTGAVYLFFAFILYGFLVAVRKFPRGRGHRKLVVFTRVYIRFHIAFAVTGAALVLWHAAGMVLQVSISGKSASGFLAVGALVPLLWTGYRRKQKSSGKRRRHHRYTAFVFILIASLHILL